MSIKEAADKVRKQTEELKEEVKETVQTITDMVPRPIMERPTLVLTEPILARLRKRRRLKR